MEGTQMTQMTRIYADKENPVRDLMWVENVKPHDTPHPVRDAITEFDGFIPTGCRFRRAHCSFYQHLIPNGMQKSAKIRLIRAIRVPISCSFV